MNIFFTRVGAAAVLASASSGTPVIAQDTMTALRAALPRDLSPWGMFLTANDVVQIVIVGLVLASAITWTVGIAKAIELLALKRKLRGALATLDGARSSVQAEQELDAKSPAAVVAPGIAEALLATAIGLVAAIPAVVIYNMFARMSTGCRVTIGDAAAAMMRLVSRDIDRGTAMPKLHAAE
jgi:biopolymer transport protein ExbB/TolQ